MIDEQQLSEAERAGFSDDAASSDVQADPKADLAKNLANLGDVDFTFDILEDIVNAPVLDHSSEVNDVVTPTVVNRENAGNGLADGATDRSFNSPESSGIESSAATLIADSELTPASDAITFDDDFLNLIQGDLKKTKNKSDEDVVGDFDITPTPIPSSIPTPTIPAFNLADSAGDNVDIDDEQIFDLNAIDADRPSTYKSEVASSTSIPEENGSVPASRPPVPPIPDKPLVASDDGEPKKKRSLLIPLILGAITLGTLGGLLGYIVSHGGIAGVTQAINEKKELEKSDKPQLEMEHRGGGAEAHGPNTENPAVADHKTDHGAVSPKNETHGITTHHDTTANKAEVKVETTLAKPTVKDNHGSHSSPPNADHRAVAKSTSPKTPRHNEESPLAKAETKPHSKPIGTIHESVAPPKKVLSETHLKKEKLASAHGLPEKVKKSEPSSASSPSISKKPSIESAKTASVAETHKESPAKTAKSFADGGLTKPSLSALKPADKPKPEDHEPPKNFTPRTTSQPKNSVVTLNSAPPASLKPSVFKPAGKSDIGLFSVQVCSSPSRDDANEWLDRLKDKRVTSGFLSTQTVRGKTYYRVRFGQFTSRQEAEVAAQKLGFAAVWVDRIK